MLNTHSALVLAIAQWVAIAIVVLVMFIMAYILFLRGSLIRKERRYRRLAAMWRPILLDHERVNCERLPPVQNADRLSFLILWNMLREKKNYDAKAREWMNQVAVATGIVHTAIGYLAKHNVRRKLLAVVTLGQLHDRSQWDELCRLAVSDHALLSLAATQALVRIDPAAAVPIIIPLLVHRAEWPTAKVASILRDIGPDLMSRPLTDAILKAPDEEMQRLTPLLETCHVADALSAVQRILEGHHDDKVIGHCLYVIAMFQDKSELARVRRYLAHPRWHVRASAATCLGKIGTGKDEEPLKKLLADTEWWVRYRAAEAIVNLSSSSVERICKLRETLTDRYARDILAQVIAEKGLPCR